MNGSYCWLFVVALTVGFTAGHYDGYSNSMRRAAFEDIVGKYFAFDPFLNANRRGRELEEQSPFYSSPLGSAGRDPKLLLVHSASLGAEHEIKSQFSPSHQQPKTFGRDFHQQASEEPAFKGLSPPPPSNDFSSSGRDHPEFESDDPPVYIPPAQRFNKPLEPKEADPVGEFSGSRFPLFSSGLFNFDEELKAFREDDDRPLFSSKQPQPYDGYSSSRDESESIKHHPESFRPAGNSNEAGNDEEDPFFKDIPRFLPPSSRSRETGEAPFRGQPGGHHLSGQQASGRRPFDDESDERRPSLIRASRVNDNPPSSSRQLKNQYFIRQPNVQYYFNTDDNSDVTGNQSDEEYGSIAP